MKCIIGWLEIKVKYTLLSELSVQVEVSTEISMPKVLFVCSYKFTLLLVKNKLMGLIN